LTQPDSTMSIEDYAKVYKERGHHVLCISEHGNRSNVWQQFELANKYSDDTFKMTPLAAAEAYFVPDRKAEIDGKKDNRNFHLILIARNMEGFYQLNEILSEANLTGYYYHARVDFDLLGRLNPANFICTTACVGGIWKDPGYERYACQLHEIFRDSFYLEIQHHPQEIQIETNQKVLKLYQKYKWPLIYGTDSHYIYKEEKELRRELLLSSGITYGQEDEFLLYLPTAEEAYQMLQEQGVFTNARIQEAMENTLILREFEGVSFTTEKKIPNSHPDMPLDRRNYLFKKTVCDEYIQKSGMPTKEEAAEIHKEMDMITETGTADYFLILKKIVEKGIEYGGRLTKTGRGSGASFSTNYSLGFSSINRLRCPVKMYPERFISKDRLVNGLPDLDLNMANVQAFERAGKELLGEYGCLPMIAYGTVKTLSAFKLLARARDLDFETSNEISKQIKNYEMDVKHAIENNADDPDYDVNDDVHIENYIDEKYLELIEASKQYRGIVTTLVPHPCAHILLDKDIRREIGVIRVKSKSGSKEPVYAAFIDGKTADAYNYLKADFLRVDVVKLIYETFALIGIPVMTVDELLKAAANEPEIWDLYAKGYTMALNQVEREKSTQRVMQYKPKNVCELTAFIAGIRPGFKSMLSTFIARDKFAYNISSLDKLLATKEIPDSFLLYDEQILQILIAAGIPAADAYAATKAIKKKKADKVASYKEKFKNGFTEYLRKTEGADEKKAHEVVEQVWTIIENAANYMFCCAHAFSMACDSLYAAWLKVHYPYELYITLLKLYDEKKNKDKIAQIISEMKRYKEIRLIPGRFGQDNRDWTADKENKTISQSLSSVRYISKADARALYIAGQKNYDSFTDVLRELQMNTPVDIRTIKILIELDYFIDYGQSGKLMNVYEEFFNGPNRLTKIIKSYETRLAACRAFEQAQEDVPLPMAQRLICEHDNVGICLSSDPELKQSLYFVQETDTKYGAKAKLYSIRTGKSGSVRIRKDDFAKRPFEPNQIIRILDGRTSPKYTFKDGQRIPIPGETEYWVSKYVIIKPA
jgi:DNA polymerase III alpha subunit